MSSQEPTERVKTIQLAAPQRKALRALRRGQAVCIPWGRGGGKSWFIRLFWYLLVSEWDGRLRPGARTAGVRIVLLMPTLEQAKKVHAALMLGELAGEWAHLGARVHRTEWRVTFPGGSWIQWVTAERAKGLRGMRCDVLCVDECDDVDKEVIDAIAEPWFSEPHSLAMLLVGGTPTRGRYGLLYRSHRRGTGQMLHEETGERFTDHHSFHATSYDFPRHVSRDAIERTRGRIAPAVFKREWLCDFDAAEGLVYSLFEEDFHVTRPERDAVWTEVLIGVDHGWEDPGCFLVLGVAGSGRDRTVHVLQEIYETHKVEDWWEQQAQGLWRKYPEATWYADPSRPDRIAALRKVGMRIRPAKNALEDGVDFVANFMARRPLGPTEQAYTRFHVAPSCAETIREMGLYKRKRDPRNKERVLDDIEDKNNHAMDALRYALFSHYGGAAPEQDERDDFEQS